MTLAVGQAGRACFTDGPSEPRSVAAMARAATSPVPSAGEVLAAWFPPGNAYRLETLPDGSFAVWRSDPDTATEDGEAGWALNLNARNRAHYGQPPAKPGR